jgi:ubiquinone/menaquinone biosynthesis C-methylase UbiE
VTAFYDRFANSYDWVTRWVSRYRSPEIIAAHLLPLTNQSSRVLDVGIGTGASIRELIRSRKFSRIVGIDSSAGMLKRCRAKYPAIELIEGNIAALGPELDGQFDFVVSCGAVEHMPDLPIFLRHAHRLLAESGHLLFTYEPLIARSLFQRKNSSHLGSFGAAEVFRHEPSEVATQLAKAGFTILKDIPFRAYFWLTHQLIVARI